MQLAGSAELDHSRIVSIRVSGTCIFRPGTWATGSGPGRSLPVPSWRCPPLPCMRGWSRSAVGADRSRFSSGPLPGRGTSAGAWVGRPATALGSRATWGRYFSC
jgi:hypothetical protein